MAMRGSPVGGAGGGEEVDGCPRGDGGRVCGGGILVELLQALLLS